MVGGVQSLCELLRPITFYGNLLQLTARVQKLLFSSFWSKYWQERKRAIFLFPVHLTSLMSDGVKSNNKRLNYTDLAIANVGPSAILNFKVDGSCDVSDVCHQVWTRSTYPFLTYNHFTDDTLSRCGLDLGRFQCIRCIDWILCLWEIKAPHNIQGTNTVCS